MNKILILIFFLFTTSVFCQTEQRTIKKETFEVTCLDDWETTNVKGYDNKTSIAIYKKKSSFMIISGFLICKEEDSLTEIYNRILKEDKSLSNYLRVKERIDQNFITIEGLWKLKNNRRRRLIRYYKSGTNIFKVEFSSSIEGFKTDTLKRELFFDSFKIVDN